MANEERTFFWLSAFGAQGFPKRAMKKSMGKQVETNPQAKRFLVFSGQRIVEPKPSGTPAENV